MQVNIRLNQKLLSKIKIRNKDGLRQMHLGNDVVTQEFQKMDIDNDLIESAQCKHWMEVEAVAVEKKAVEPKKIKKIKKD